MTLGLTIITVLAVLFVVDLLECAIVLIAYKTLKKRISERFKVEISRIKDDDEQDFYE